MSASGAEAREPFSTAEQQRNASMFGMTIFLASEILLFGGLIALILLNRIAHPEAMVRASSELHVWLGALNTLVLLSSSFFAAVAVVGARLGRAGIAVAATLGASLLGTGFLGIKTVEYATEFQEGSLPIPGGDFTLSDPVRRLFMDLYFVSTGLHAVHLTVGIVLLFVIAFRVWTRSIALPRRAVLVEVPILYWHLVDMIWVALYLTLYLAR